MDLLNLVEIDDEVRVVITVEGKLSGSTGVHYNNLVAQNIT
ncbi:hypothetical protein [Flavobacterium rivuli]|nr:hypothetical protein [Flavobacterium rivuli]